jgi:hypothetical protein
MRSAKPTLDSRFISGPPPAIQVLPRSEGRSLSQRSAGRKIVRFGSPDRAEGRYTLDGAIVQADNNDAYLLSYRDPDTGNWLPLWTVPPAYSFGMATRPGPLDATKRQVLPRIVTTDAVRLEAEFGDGMYSVAEIQLFGVPAGP